MEELRIPALLCARCLADGCRHPLMGGAQYYAESRHNRAEYAVTIHRGDALCAYHAVDEMRLES